MKNIIQNGPRAPKDPQKKRSGFYIMVDKIIEATGRLDGTNSQEVYLDEDRLSINANFVGGVQDKEILEMLKTWEGARKLIHSIGVSVTASDDVGNIDFLFCNYGKVNRYGGGTKIKVPCTKNGSEVMINFSDYKWNEDDDVVGKIAFEFEKPGLSAKATVKVYLNEPYKVSEIEIDKPVDFKSENYKNMISKSLLNLGNNKRLKNAIKKAERGEDVTIAYIGGSITQGAGAKPINTNCYAYKSYEKFKEMFGKGNGENVHFIKAGVGGTPSELGMIRYERDVLRDGKVKPDVVFVEFAVNDEGDETQGVCYESLVKSILSYDYKPAVILIFAVFANDWNLQNRLSPVGKLYDLPMVSISDAVVDQFKLSKDEGNVLTKRQYFYDIYHPTNDGHRIMSDCIVNLLRKTAENPVDEHDITLHEKPVIGDSFMNMHLIDKKDNKCNAEIISGSFTEIDKDIQCVEMDDNFQGTLQFPYNWMHGPECGDDSFKIKVESRSLLLVFKDSGSLEFGKADIYVDGKLKLTADPKIIGWTHCNAVILYEEKSSCKHEIEIKMADDSKNKYFTILGFGYN